MGEATGRVARKVKREYQTESGLAERKEPSVAYNGDKYMHCRKCGKKTKWVRCPQPPGCSGKGDTSWTQCGNGCEGGYKCENGTRDKYHS